MFRSLQTVLFLLVFVSAPIDRCIAAAMDTDQAVAYLADRLIAKRHGEIARVKGKDVYIALGDEDGILDGSQFDIVRLGDAIEVRGQVLGYEERLIGKAIAKRVLEKLTIAESLAALDSPRVGDRAYLMRGPVTRIVVAPFTFRGGITGLSQQIQEGLTTALLKEGVSVVERSQLDQILAEQKLGYSGLMKLDSAKKLGELLGADAIILGSLRDLGEEVAVTARLVALETGTGYTAAQAKIAKTQMVARQLAEPVPGVQLVGTPSPSTSGGFGSSGKQAYPTQASAGGTFTAGNLTLAVDNIVAIENGHYRVIGTATNNRDESVMAIFFAPTEMIDPMGNYFKPTGATGIRPCAYNDGRDWHSRARNCDRYTDDATVLLPEIPQRFTLQFASSSNRKALGEQVQLTGRLRILGEKPETMRFNFPAIRLPDLPK